MTKETQAGSYVAGEYGYDADGRRVIRKVGAVETWQVYGIGGELLAEYAQNGSATSPQKEYGYRNDELLVTATVISGWGAAPSYTGPNPLQSGDEIKLVNLTELRTAVNSLRFQMVFDQTGSLANVSRHDYLPFGEEVPAGLRGIPGYATSDNVRQKFTLKERDNETGLDYFLARYYSSRQGRFTSVDPARDSGKKTNPQSWSRYTYAFNNPLRYIDPDGKYNKDVHYYLTRELNLGSGLRFCNSRCPPVSLITQLPGRITKSFSRGSGFKSGTKNWGQAPILQFSTPATWLRTPMTHVGCKRHSRMTTSTG